MLNQINIFINAIKSYYKNCFNFKGTADRPEFWYPFLYNTLIFVIISGSLNSVVLVVLYFANIIPAISLTVRRMHDTNRSGWKVLWGIIPLGWIYLLICVVGESRPNYWENSNLKSNKYNLVMEDKFCSKCGSQIEENSKFCTICGNNLSQSNYKKEPEIFHDLLKTSNGKLTLKGKVVLAILSIVILILAFSWYSENKACFGADPFDIYEWDGPFCENTLKRDLLDIFKSTD